MMSRYDDFRAPYSAHPGGGGGGGGGDRWDSERFLRERERDRYGGGPPPRGPPVLERDRFDFDPRHSSSVLERRPPVRFEDTYFTDERYGPPARRPGRTYEEDDFFYERERDRRGPPPPPSAGAMVPFDRSRRDPYDFPDGRRPGLLRRQSSLDTFDRRPHRRFDGYDREDFRPQPPPVIPVPVPSRRREPEYLERDFEDIRIAEPDYYGDEEYRNFREREWTTRRSLSRPRFPSPPRETETFEEEVIEEKPFPRRGKTRMPRRLVHVKAIIQLGYPYEEEGEVIVIGKALGKENIDEVVALSREIKAKEIKDLETKEITRTTYLIEGPPAELERKEEEIIKERVVTSPPPSSEVPRSVREWDMLKVERSPSPGGKSTKSHRSRSRRRRDDFVEKTEIHKEVRESSPSRTIRSSRSRRRSSPVVVERREIIEDDRDGSSSFHAGPLAIVSPERSRNKTDREIKEEIRRLEAERRHLRDERRHRRVRDSGETEIVIDRGEPLEVVEVRKDRKAPDPRIIKAMMTTLT